MTLTRIESDILSALERIKEGTGIAVSNESGIEIGTTYSLLETLEKRGLLLLREVKEIRGSRVKMNRLYRLNPERSE